MEDELSKLKPEAAREKVMRLTNPFIELGIERGIRKGRQDGELELVLRLLRRRFGALSHAHGRAIRKLDIAKIEALAESLLNFRSREDLTRWLKKNAC